MKILKMCGYCRWLEVTDSRLGGVRIQGEEAVYMDTWVTAVYIHSLYIKGNRGGYIVALSLLLSSSGK